MILLLGSSLMSTLAGCLFWTGFPLLLSSLNHNDYNLSQIYFSAILGSLGFDLLGGIISDSRFQKRAAVVCQFLCALLVMAISAFLKTKHLVFAIYSLPLLYFILAMSNVVESKWLLAGFSTAELKHRFFNRTFLVTCAKLIGFGAGPLIFIYFGFMAIFFCATLYIGAGIIQSYLLTKRELILTQKIKDIMKSSEILAELAGLKSVDFIFGCILVGLVSIPLNPFFVQKILLFKSVSLVSAFWVCGGIASLIGLLLIRKIETAKLKQFFLPITILALGFIIYAFISKRAFVVIGFSSLYICCCPLFSFYLQIYAGISGPEISLGRRLGTLNFLIDLGVCLGFFVGSKVQVENMIPVLLSVCLLLVLRLVFLIRLPIDSRVTFS